MGEDSRKSKASRIYEAVEKRDLKSEAIYSKFACQLFVFRLVQKLIRDGIDVNSISDKYGVSSLHLISGFRYNILNFELLSTLLKNNGNPNVK